MTALDDCFAFPERRLLHREAIALLTQAAQPLGRLERVSVFNATGRISAESLTAPRAIPAHTNAAVDGFAFAHRSYDSTDGTVFFLAGRAAAGDAPLPAVEAGKAIRIFTGAIMPAGCDTVAMREDCRAGSDGTVFVPGGLKQGANRRLAGEDTAQGETILTAGIRLRPQDVAALAASGYDTVACHARPRVCIFSTGNEVVPPGRTLAPGQVYDANGPLLAGLFAPLGARVTYGGILPDRRDAVLNALSEAAQHHDMIITSGGASLGDEDHVINALRAADALTLWQLAIKPGRPMGLGKIGSCLCCALPGNPVAVFVCALLYVWPVVRRLGGEPWAEPPRITVPAGFNIPSRKTGRREFFRGWMQDDGRSTPVAVKYERDGSGLISSLRAATGLVEVTEDTDQIREGDSVSFIPLSSFGIF